MIEIRKLGKTYESGSGVVAALDDVSFAISEGEFVSIIGPSGCGKTTLIKLIGDLIKPTSGRVSIDGLPAREARLKQTFSFVFQNPVLLPWRTILDNVRLPMEILHRGARDPVELLGKLGLGDFIDSYPNELSGGMQQRVALARALTFDPKVLLMDEPFSKVDEFTRNDLNHLLLSIWKETGVTILFVTHSVEEAVYLSDRVVVLTQRPGRVADVVGVPAGRPRDPESKDTRVFQELVTCLRQKLQ